MTFSPRSRSVTAAPAVNTVQDAETVKSAVAPRCRRPRPSCPRPPGTAPASSLRAEHDGLIARCNLQQGEVDLLRAQAGTDDDAPRTALRQGPRTEAPAVERAPGVGRNAQHVGVDRRLCSDQWRHPHARATGGGRGGVPPGRGTQLPRLPHADVRREGSRAPGRCAAQVRRPSSSRAGCRTKTRGSASACSARSSRSGGVVWPG